MSDLIERLRAATMGFDWSDLPDDALIPAVPLLREAADRIASLEAERDDARQQRDEIGRAWDKADARAKEAEERAARLEKALAEAREALEPFARIAHQFDRGNLKSIAKDDDKAAWGYNDANLTYGDFRRAASLCSSKDGE